MGRSKEDFMEIRHLEQKKENALENKVLRLKLRGYGKRKEFRSNSK